MSQIIKNLSGGPPPPDVLTDIDVQTGTSPVVPAGNTITFNGATVAAGTHPVRTDGTGPSTMALEVQFSQAIASTNATNVGLSAFNSAQFTVDANGFVSLSGTGAGETITGNTGGALSPVAGNWNIVGGTGITTSGSGNTLTVSVINDSFGWSEQSTSFAAAIQNGYYCNAGLTVTLPATAGLAIGNTIIIYVDTTSTVIIQANTGQIIQVSDQDSSAGGTATSTALGNLLELNFKPSDSTWHTIASMGSWTVV